MIGKIVSYRRGRHNQNPKQALVRVDVENREDIVGKKATWTSKSGKKITGKISSPHGNKNVVRVIFKKGIPGQAIGEKVEIK